MTTLPAEVHAVFDGKEFVTLCTLLPDGSPHLTVLWVARDGDDILLSSVEGRQNAKALARDHRATVLLSPQGHPYSYVEVRGTTTLTHDGARELIDALHEKYHGTRPYPYDTKGEVRVLIRLTPTKVVVRDIARAVAGRDPSTAGTPNL